jgi:hypothetical protein
MTEYTKQANTFAKKHGVKLSVIDTDYRKHFPDDKQARTVFKLRLQRGRKQYTFDFGQSIAAGGEEPEMYNVLTCLQKHDVGTFEDFCGDFGYDTDSRTHERIYKAVCKEYAAVDRLFGDILDELQEIQ